MKSVKYFCLAAALWVLASCVGGLSPGLRRDIADEHNRLQQAAREINHSRETVEQEVAAHPQLFQNASAPAQWKADFETARQTLQKAKETDRDLAGISARDRAESRGEAEQLLARVRMLRRNAIDQSQTIVAAADHWMNFRHDLSSNLSEMERRYRAIRSADLAPIGKVVERAEIDWQAKKEVLAARLATLRSVPDEADAVWKKTADTRQIASSGNATDSQLATLIEASDTLTSDAQKVETQPTELTAQAGQLYDSWDKILTDLDKNDNLYRERIKTVRTHLVDVQSKQSETSSSEQWVPVSEATFNSVENDVGMSLVHKDIGFFDSEAVTTPQPAGFAYIASESQGSNQYGYWTHEGDHSVWTWLPQYLLLRELLWNHAYHPVFLNEYRGYRVAEQVGRTYYGQPTPAAPPKYGTHGSFTKTSYASSRYVQSGGFKNSVFASHGSFSSARAEANHGPSLSSKNGGWRFGFGASPSSGKRFGSSGGSRGFGRSFGRRH
jgi:hypothetical protein